MKANTKVIHYINQFFGGVGGENKARLGPQLRIGPVGPGIALQEAIKEWADIVATVVCGDDFFAERTKEAVKEIIRLISPYNPDLIVAGPAFNAGRYGVAAGEICKSVKKSLGIPAVTAMYEENPGVELYRKPIYIVKTSDSIKGMLPAISSMANIGWKLATGEAIGKPDEEGYFPRGYIKTVVIDETSAERAVGMLLKKIKGLDFVSELPPPKNEFDRISPAPPVAELSDIRIALVTDGGLVPKGNPDGIPSSRSSTFGSYSIKVLDKFRGQEYEANHIGYDTILVNENPDILVPLDVMRELEHDGLIGKLNDTFYSTTGVGTPLKNSRLIGQGIAKQLQGDGVTAVILTST